MYAKLEDLKDALNITATIGDVLLSQYLVRAQAAIDTYCRRTFEADADSTRRFDAVRDVEGRMLWLDWDLCQITSVTNGNGVVIAANDYVAVPRHGAPYYAIRLRGSAQGWTYTGDNEDAIAIVGRWAYSVIAPSDVQAACLMLASFYHNRRGTEGYASMEVSNALVTEFDASGIPAHIAKLLDPYRRLI